MKEAFYIGYRGCKEAYIYIWFSKSERFVYVGETNGKNGVVGRAYEHVNHKSGTLYNRVYEEGYDMDEINDFVLLSYPLPREKTFTSDETTYRISVEYLVQKFLIGKRKNIQECPYKIISRVVSGEYTGMRRLVNIAESIANDFIEIYIEA